jgi:hypothetical protein
VRWRMLLRIAVTSVTSLPIGQALRICKGLICWRKQASIFLWWVCESWVFGLAGSKIHRFVMSDVHWSSRLLYIAYAFVLR